MALRITGTGDFLNVNSARWIRAPGDLGPFVRSLEGTSRIALDTESDSFHHYYFKVCILQIADPQNRVALVDPLAVKDLSALAPVMADPGIDKVLHGAAYDIALLKRDFGFECRSIVDTEVLARFCGRTSLGLQALLESELGIRLPKDLQQFDWSRRPLSSEHEEYLAGDVRHLLALADRLWEELRRLGREEWVREECDAMSDIPAAIPREVADFMRVKGWKDLDPKVMFILRELYALRETWAQNQDRPPFMVVGNEALVNLATRRPRSVGELDRIKGLPAKLRARRGEELLGAIRRGEASREPLPVRVHKPRMRPSRAWHGRVKRLKGWRDEISKRLALDPAILMPNRLAESLATAAPVDPETLAAVEGVRRWRVKEFGGELLSALNP